MDSIPSILALVVLYRCSLKESSTVLSLLKAREAGILKLNLAVYDNSPETLSNSDLALIEENQDWITYLHFPENLSLAKIYNMAIKSGNNEDFLLIFDQDSSFNSAFFYSFYSSFKNNSDIDLFIPQVKHKQILVSPGRWLGYKGKYLPSIVAGRINSKGLTAIGSGMIIRLKYLKSEFKGFDERFSLYAIDTYFMQQFSSSEKNMFILPYQMGHDLADFKLESLESKIFRFDDFVKGNLYLVEDSWLNKMKCIIFICYKAFKFAFKFRNPAFLKALRFLVSK